tara:strand:- start:15781 stop:17247 length:1467 start_codon:yes stop_codon:yes gene_type:complete
MAIKSQYISASTAIFINNFLQLLTLAICARIFPPDQFALYLTITSMAWVISPLTSFMMNDSLSYYLGKGFLNQSDERGLVYGLLLKYFCHISFGLLISYLIFNFISYFELIKLLKPHHFLVFVSAFLLTSSRFMFEAIYRFLNLREKFATAPISYITTFGILPLVILVNSSTSDITEAVLKIAICTFLIVFFLLFTTIINPFKKNSILNSPNFSLSKKIYVYGIQRIPLAFSFSVIMGLPIFYSQATNQPSSTIIVVGTTMSLLKILGQINQVMTYVALPSVSNLVEKDWHKNGSIYFNNLKNIAFIVSFAFFCGSVGAGDVILKIWLDEESINSNLTIFYWIAVFPLVNFYFFRSPIDGLSVISKNTKNILISLVILIGLILSGIIISSTKVSFGIYFLISISALALLSVRVINKEIKSTEKSPIGYSKNMFCFSLILFLISIFARLFVDSNNNMQLDLLILFGISISCLIYITYLIKVSSKLNYYK